MFSRFPLSLTACALALAGCAQTAAFDTASVTRGKAIYAAECAQCHGATGMGGGDASLGLGAPPPTLAGLTARNDGVFPRAFVQRFVLGKVEKEDVDAAMPDFGTVGLAHMQKAGDVAQVSSEDMTALLDYLETLQK
ncbi:cytochrome c [Sulfitobacter sp. HNIBRBA2951]|uniref:c-type cytochrome n=1 Tax=Sulfitobacter aquimarinus TaxID=3158557 RepID=UPI0032E04F0F